MTDLGRGICVAFVLLVLVPAFGQSVITTSDKPAFDCAQPPNASRMLAGLRAYPDDVIEAIVLLADCPTVTADAARIVGDGGDPLVLVRDASSDLHAALKVLARTPEAILLAAECPAVLQELRWLWTVVPEGAAARLAQLRLGYEEAARRAARGWQLALQEDPVAMGEYRDLLTRFCASEREANPDFACVRVADRRYYYACPPTEDLIGYAIEVGLPGSLLHVMRAWWTEHTPQTVDRSCNHTGVPPPAALLEGESVYEASSEGRAGMWQSMETDAGRDTVGYVPVIMQPPADQPPAARLAFAVAEHERLWAPAQPALVLGDAPRESERAATEEFEPEADWSSVVVAETIPGPLTARYEDALKTRDYSYRTGMYYLNSRPSVVYYGNAAYDPFFDDLLGTPASRYSVVYPSRVYRSQTRCRTGGHVGLGLRLTSSRHDDRHRGNDVRTGRGISVRIGGRSGRRASYTHITPRNSGRAVRVPRSHSPGGRSAYFRGPINRMGRGSAGTRVNHPETRQLRAVPRSIHTESRAIRSGSHVIRPGSHTSRLGSPSVRPGSRAIRGGTSRGDGTRRR